MLSLYIRNKPVFKMYQYVDTTPSLFSSFRANGVKVEGYVSCPVQRYLVKTRISTYIEITIRRVSHTDSSVRCI
jgi:hypothetical protein